MMVVYNNSQYTVHIIDGQRFLYQDDELLGSVIEVKPVGYKVKIVFLNSKGNVETRWVKQIN